VGKVLGGVEISLGLTDEWHHRGVIASHNKQLQRCKVKRDTRKSSQVKANS